MRVVRVQSANYGRHAGRTLLRAVVLASVVLSAGLAARAADEKDDDDVIESNNWATRMENTVKESFGNAGKKIGIGKPPAPPPSETSSGCPTIAILPGTEVQRVMAPGGTGNQSLKYQYSLLNVGRECAVSGDRVTIKVGADGRVLLGPAGAAGRFDVPIRVAVFSEAQHRAVESRLFKVPVALNAGQAAAPFDFVSQGLTVAIPPGRSAEYSIKVGIDAGKGGGADTGATKRARKRKPAAATESASGEN